MARGEPLVHYPLRIPPDAIDRGGDLLRAMLVQFPALTLSDVLRAALVRGLDCLEKEFPRAAERSVPR